MKYYDNEKIYINNVTKEETVILEYTSEATFETTNVSFKKEFYDIALDIFKNYGNFGDMIITNDKKSLCFGIDLSDNRLARINGSNLYKITIEKI